MSLLLLFLFLSSKLVHYNNLRLPDSKLCLPIRNYP